MNLFKLIPTLKEIQADIRALTEEIRKLRLELRRLAQSDRRAPAKAPAATRPRSAARPKAINVPSIEARSVSVARTAQKAASYLHQKGFVIGRYHEHDADSAEERTLSKFLGDRHEKTLAPLYSLLRDVEVNEHFRLDLADSTPQEIGDSVQLCQLLSQVQYLHNFDYVRSERQLTGSLTRDGDAYIRGRWLEQYIRRQLVSGFGRAQMGYSLLMNPQLSFVDGQKYELDLFVLERDAPIWIECTTAKNPRERLNKMPRLRAKLDIPQQRTLLIVTGMSEQRIRGFSRGTDFRIVNVSDFPAILHRNLENSV